jgi:hypothetical protein
MEEKNIQVKESLKNQRDSLNTFNLKLKITGAPTDVVYDIRSVLNRENLDAKYRLHLDKEGFLNATNTAGGKTSGPKPSKVSGKKSADKNLVNLNDKSAKGFISAEAKKAIEETKKSN